jgi:hypothetical protein
MLKIEKSPSNKIIKTYLESDFPNDEENIIL